MERSRPQTFTDLLTPRELDALESSREGAYGLWPDLTIAYLNPAWRRSVESARARLGIAGAWNLGTSVLEAITPDLRTFYDRVLRASLAKGRPWSHELHCARRGTPCRYRLDVRPLAGRRGLLVGHPTASECPHGFAPCCSSRAEPGEYEDEHGLVVQCVHCRRVRSADDPERWDLVPDWVEHTPENSSGGLCETCADLHFPGLTLERGPRRTGSTGD